MVNHYDPIVDLAGNLSDMIVGPRFFEVLKDLGCDLKIVLKNRRKIVFSISDGSKRYLTVTPDKFVISDTYQTQ